MNAQINDANGVLLWSMSGEESQVVEGILDYLSDPSSADALDLIIEGGEPSLRSTIASGLRNRLAVISPECDDLRNPEFVDHSVSIEASLEPAWASIDDNHRLTLCFWSSDTRMHFRATDCYRFDLRPQSLWVGVHFWDADTGNTDSELGLLAENVVFNFYDNGEWFSLDLRRAPAKNEIVTEIVNRLTPPRIADESLAALYLLGLPCDGTLDESDFVSLSQFSETFEWMVRLVIDPPEGLVETVRESLLSRTSGALRVALETLNEMPHASHEDRNASDLIGLLREVGGHISRD
jgi:hypothetical protein